MSFQIPTLVDRMEKVMQLMRTPKGPDGPPYFSYGHRREMVHRLSNKDKQKAKDKKYPIFLLRLDVDEVVKDGMVHYPSINIAILYYTTPDRYTDERYEKVIKPILQPLYEKFITEALPNSGLFMWEGDQECPPHRKLDRPYWGTFTEEGNKNLFADEAVDAIEILDLKLSATLKTC